MAAPPEACRHHPSRRYYGIVPEDTDGVEFEAQIVDVTARDHALREVDLTRAGLGGNDFRMAVDGETDAAPTALRIDLHLVDERGRTVMCTIESEHDPYQMSVDFVLHDGVGEARLVTTVCTACHLDQVLLKRTMKVRRLSTLVGFEPLQSDPTQRRTHTVVTLAFATEEQARRARRVRLGSVGEALDQRLDAATAFLIERGIDACGWVRIKGARAVPADRRCSAAQVELRGGVSCVTPSDRRGLAPFLVAAYDIETYGSRGGGVFPDADIDADCVCAISTTYWRVGAPVHERVNVVMVVADAVSEAHGADTAVECYPDEAALLNAWSESLRRAGASIVTGYNIYRFDNAYLAARARKLRLTTFWHLGMHLADRAREAEFRLESAAFGQNEGITFHAPGRVVLDLMQHIMQSYKLPLFNLNYVSQHFLGETKADLDIPTMFRHIERREFDPIIQYVKKDSELVQLLLQDRDVVSSVWAMGRATSTLPSALLTRGQQIRILNCLRRTCAAKSIALTRPPASIKRKYVGARVVSPKCGHYTDPVITLDFASLYPSIIRAYNLCYQTHIPSDRLEATRRDYPDLEIVEHGLEWGQVWKEVATPPPGSVELQGCKELRAIIKAQRKAGYVDVALSEDELATVRRAWAARPLTSATVVRAEDGSLYQPTTVRHAFAKGVPLEGGGERRCPSVLPDILAELGTLRKGAKRAMAAAEAAAAERTAEAERLRALDPPRDLEAAEAERAARSQAALAALGDKEQLAYKVVMNSLYGFTAADTMRLLALAETITYLGRRALGDAIQVAHEELRAMGVEGEVVYGDTDSIFVVVRGATSEEAMRVGARVSEASNAHFARTTKSTVLKLEFEALFQGLVLLGKKCYAGRQHGVLEDENGSYTLSAKPKYYKKGMRAVRRDTPPFVARVQSASLDLLLDTGRIDGVCGYLREQVTALVERRVPIEDLKITMQLKREEDYHKEAGVEVAKQPHLRLVKKLEERSRQGLLPDGCTLWTPGERVPFYYADSHEEELSCDRAEDPEWGRVHGVAFDVVHYFDLTKKALQQGLGLLKQVGALMEELESALIAPMRARATKLRRLTTQRRELAKRGQKPIGAFLGRAPGTPAAEGPSGRPPSPKRPKRLTTPNIFASGLVRQVR